MANTFSLGAKLRALRNERSLSQRELASQAGISTNAVSLIERNEISPSVATLQCLASAMNVRMSYFFDNNVQKNVLYMKAEERPNIISKGVRIGSIGEKLRQQVIEPFFVSLEPHSGSGERYVIHSGHEFVYCLHGSIEYVIDGHVYQLNEGDLLLFEAQLPHMWHNPLQERSDFLLILQAPDETDESVQRHFLSNPSLSHLT